MGVVQRGEFLVALYGRLRQLARFSVGRVTGTTLSTDGGYKFMVDQAESRLFHRAEINALTGLLMRKGIMNMSEWRSALESELGLMLKETQAEFPECVPATDGKSFSLDLEKFAKRCREEKWPK